MTLTAQTNDFSALTASRRSTRAFTDREIPAEVLDAMNADSGVPLKELKVDGGMTHDDLVMQFQADLCGVDVVRPKVIETTALGAAYAAGMAVGYWSGTEDVVANWQEGKRWTPSMEPAERDRTYRLWKKAVTRTLDWVDDDVK